MLSQIRYWLRTAFRRKATEAELSEELQAHLERQTEKYMASGLAPEEARRQARVELGGVEQIQEECRAGWGARRLSELGQDLRYALRQMRRQPSFTAVAVLTLALGIGINTVIFSAVSAMLLRKPQVANPDRLFTISMRNRVTTENYGNVSIPDFESWQKQNRVFQSLATVESWRSFTLTGRHMPEIVAGDRVTTNYFQIIGLRPILGRAFHPGEDRPGHSHVIVLSHNLWRQRYHADSHVIGKNLEINHSPYTIVGVMPRHGAIPMPFIAPRLWLPLVFRASDHSAAARGHRILTMVLGRLHPGISARQAQAAMNVAGERLAKRYPKYDRDWGITVAALQQYLIHRLHEQKALIMLVIVAGAVLLLACVNIAGLLLARGATREHEMSMRSALGARRLRLVRQMLVESLLLGGAGGAAGLLLSLWGIRLLQSMIQFNTISAQWAPWIHLDHRTLLFTAAITLATAFLFGLLPALRASKTDAGAVLQANERMGTSGSTHHRLRGMLVVLEITLAVALLALAGITTQMFRQVINQPLGFQPQNLWLLSLRLRNQAYAQPAAQITFYRQALSGLRQIPGVESAAQSDEVPLENYWTTTFSIMGRPRLPRAKRPRTQSLIVGPGYFSTLRIPLLAGRKFANSDTLSSPLVAVVNRDFARAYFPHRNAIGQWITLDHGPNRLAKIVGVVGKVLPYLGKFTATPQVYESYLQAPLLHSYLIVRARLDRAMLIPAMLRAIWALDRGQTIGRIASMRDVIADSRGGNAIFIELIGTFAMLALLLSAVGIYGVVAFSVSRRTHEIGIRMALGAERRRVVWLILKQGALLSALGSGIGLVLALPISSLLASIFPGLPAIGPLIPIVVSLLVALVALLASYIPARHAAHIDPLMALRYE